MTSTGRRTLVALLLVAAAGCGTDARMEVDLRPEDRFPGLTVSIDDRTATETFRRSDLESLDRGGLTTGPVEVAEEGEIRVRLRLDVEGQEVADGDVRLEAREDFRWSVSFTYATSDPTDECLGCFGSVEIPLPEAHRAAPDEAIWVVWSGRREGSDVVF